MDGKATERNGAEMNSMLSYNSRRIQQNEARQNEILDYLRENPKTTQAAMLNALAKRWRVTKRTARIPLEHMKRCGLINSQVEIVTRLKINGH